MEFPMGSLHMDPTSYPIFASLKPSQPAEETLPPKKVIDCIVPSKEHGEPKKSDVLSIVFKNHGVVYGGYMRDFYAGLKPSDIDVVISENHSASFAMDMFEAGYTAKPGKHAEITLFTKEGELDVEMIECEDDPIAYWIGPCADPDYSVNLLAWDGTYLWNWTFGSEDDLSVKEIIKHIRAKTAFQLETPNPDRQKKMKKKPFEIVLPE